MTKQNYEAIADMIRHILGGSPYFHSFVDTMTSYLKDENPLFKENTFREACRSNPDCDGENTPRVKKLEEEANITIEKKLRKYQNDTYGAEAGMDRMNEMFRKQNEEIQKEKKENNL